MLQPTQLPAGIVQSPPTQQCAPQQLPHQPPGVEQNTLPGFFQGVPNGQTASPQPPQTLQTAQFLRAAGVNQDQVNQELSVLGSVSDVTKKALKDKHGEAVANLVINSIQGEAAVARIKTDTNNQHILAHVQTALADLTQQSPAESFAELKTWAQTNVDVEVRKELNTMLGMGGFQASQAINYMVEKFREANGVSQHGTFIDGGVGSTSVDQNLLTRSAYNLQLEELVNKHGYESREVEQLNAKRMAAIKRGIN